MKSLTLIQENGLETGELYAITNSHRQGGGTTKHSSSDPMQVQAIYEKSI